MSERMSDAELSDIESRAEAATAGPWGQRREEWSDGGVLLVRRTIECPEARPGQFRRPFLGVNAPSGTPEGRRADADTCFVAHARTDVPRLLEEARRARAEAKRLQEEVGRLQATLGAAVGTDAEVERLRADLERARGAEARYVAELTSLRETLVAEAEQLREERDSALADLDAASKSFLSAQGQRDAERAEVQRLRAALTSAVQTNPDAAAERARAEMAEATRDGLQEELRTALEELEEAKADRDDWHDLSNQADEEEARLQKENDEMRTALAGFVRKAEWEERILQERRALRAPHGGEDSCAPWWDMDHACAECVPGGELVREGFRCALHAAKALLGQTPEKETTT